MSVNLKLPEPIAFNCWKHHLGYVKDALTADDLYSVSHLNIHEIVQSIGESQSDFYYGLLNPTSISNQIISQIESIIALNISEYRDWIHSDGSDFKNFYLSDGSNWTVRLGINDERFVHIHPSRYSKKTVRVKSSTLKTVIAYFFHYGFSEVPLSVENVNRVRQKIVKLPPFKSNSALIAISRVSNLFFA